MNLKMKIVKTDRKSHTVYRNGIKSVYHYRVDIYAFSCDRVRLATQDPEVARQVAASIFLYVPEYYVTIELI
jgi:hypothetical protein